MGTGHRLLIALSIALLGCCLCGCRTGQAGGDNTGAAPHAGAIRLPHDACVNVLAFSPDGKDLVSASSSVGTSTLHVWDPSTGKKVREIRGRFGRVHSLVFSPDGSLLASGERDVIVIRETWMMQDVLIFGCFGDTLLAFSRDSRCLAVGVPRSAFVWQLPGTAQRPAEEDVLGRVIFRTLFDEHVYVSALAFSPQENLLAVGVQDASGVEGAIVAREIVLVQIPSGKKRTLNEYEHMRTDSIVFSPDGKMLAVRNADNTVYLWDVNSIGTEKPKYREINSANKRRFEGPRYFEIVVGPLAFSPHGKFLAGLNGKEEGKAIAIWEVASGKEVLTLRGHRATVLALAYSPDGKRLASGGADEVAIIWDIEKLLAAKSTAK